MNREKQDIYIFELGRIEQGMKILSEKRCIIGESPVWNEKESRLYYTNGFGDEICVLDINTGELRVRPVPGGAAAIAFDKDGRMIISRGDGVFYLNKDDTMEPVCRDAVRIRYANDMKAGPDGRIYVGTQSGKRKGVSDKVDGKLFCIDSGGGIRVLLDGLILSNGMAWSMDETRFYHTDSDTHWIREYDFDKREGKIAYTGRQVYVPGVDGFTMDTQDHIIAACWGQGHLAVVDTRTMEITRHIKLPCRIPASCAFVGEKQDILAVTTASYGADTSIDTMAGFTFGISWPAAGKKQYVFGGSYHEKDRSVG